MSILVTGAAGFIGSNFVLNWLSEHKEKVIALDKLTYAGNLENLKSVENHPNYVFVQGDIGNSTYRKLLKNINPEPSLILPRRVMWIDPFTDPMTLCRPISLVPIVCWKKLDHFLIP
jgi:NAD(P)-dependent dehydrogenase (short-subunit alcohol dehydrogenase family)